MGEGAGAGGGRRRRVLGDLLMRLADVQIQRAVFGLNAGGVGTSFFGMLGAALTSPSLSGAAIRAAARALAGSMARVASWRCSIGRKRSWITCAVVGRAMAVRSHRRIITDLGATDAMVADAVALGVEVLRV